MIPSIAPTPTTLVRPSRARFGVVGFAVALAMVTYLDRVCISTMSGPIMRDLSLSERQMSWVFSAFAIAYAIFELPTAWWADRRGTRFVLTRIVLWWSVLTMVTAGVLTPGQFERLIGASWIKPAIASFCLLLAVRFLFGTGEAGAWPCVAATFNRWIPAKERGRVQGIFFAGAHLCGGLTPLLVIFLLNYLHWRVIFVLFGMVGFVWVAGWYYWYRDDPSEHSGVNELELAAIVAGRRPPADHSARWEYWRRLLVHRNTLPLCLMYVGNSYAFYFCITWLPTYLKEQHGIDKAALGVAAGLPLTMSVMGDLFGGVATDHLSKRFGLRIGRAGLGAVAYLFAAGAMWIAASAERPYIAVTFLSLAVAAVMLTLGAAWGTVLDIGGHHTAVVGATMNTAGQVGAIFSPLVATYTKNHLGGWNAPLYVIAGLFLVGAISWCFIDPKDRVFD